MGDGHQHTSAYAAFILHPVSVLFLIQSSIVPIEVKCHFHTWQSNIIYKFSHSIYVGIYICVLLIRSCDKNSIGLPHRLWISQCLNTQNGSQSYIKTTLETYSPSGSILIDVLDNDTVYKIYLWPYFSIIIYIINKCMFTFIIVL